MRLPACMIHCVQVFVLVGPTGAGRSSLAQLLLTDYAFKVMGVPLLTSR
jgi:guanylate kinase